MHFPTTACRVESSPSASFPLNCGRLSAALLCALLAQAALAQSPPGVVQRSANLANPASGLCLDVAESRPRDGMNVQLGACTNATAVWDVVEVGRDEIALVNRITQRVLDVAGGSGDNGANVQQYTWNGSAAQRWRFEARVNSTHLVNVGSGKCLDIANRGTTAGSNVTQWACHDGSNQQWRFANRQPSSFGSGSPSNPPLSIPGEPSLATPPGSALPAGASQIRLVNDRLQGRRLYAGMLVSRQSGKCLDLESARNVDGTNVQQWTCHGGPGQLWDFLDAGKGEVVIVSRASNNKVLDVSGASGADGANIAQYFWNGGANQRWRLEAVDGGFFRLVSVGSGKCADLDTSRDAGRDGANVLQWSCHDKPNQQWRIEVRGSGDRWSSYRPSASLPAPDTSYADRPPSGIVGTWRGYNEAYQSEVTLTIREDGTASAIVDRDIRVSGYYRRGVLYLGTERYTLSTSRGELISRLAGQNTNAVRYQRVR